ncbi:MAG TPA: hypothetical protein VE783_12935, partial [Candidatus Limnocylindrales bacterium]|nr:hypothetical protein [Candidatus Limnocylindrales bacterium]
LGSIFSHAVYRNDSGLFTAVVNNLGDLPLHIQATSSFVDGKNLPPQDPTYSGVRFAYPFQCDFLTAMLVKCGASVTAAFWLQNMALALALVGLLHYWTLQLTGNKLAGLIAPVLLLLSGGLGWTFIFDEVRNSESGIVPLLGHLTHDYTINFGPNLRWGNAMTTLLVPQRSILFGMPLALVVFIQWWQVINRGQDQQSARQARVQMIWAGAIAGLLPLIHTHTFLVVMIMGACLALIFHEHLRSWIFFFAAAAIVAVPQVLWLMGAGTIHTSQFFAWQPGWDHGAMNPVWFWFVNAGLFIPVLILAIIWRTEDYTPSRRLLLFYAPFLLCFIGPNLFKLSPWIWDNIKVLIYWYLASLPLVAWFLAMEISRRWGWRWIAVAVLAAMLLSGGFDLIRVLTEASPQEEFNIHALAAAKMIEQQTQPRSVILNAPVYNTPVFLTGRPSVMGYPGWMWSRGLSYQQREADIRDIYAGKPQAGALLRQYGVKYVLVGPQEQSSLTVNDQYWSQHRLAAQTGEYRLYRIEEERAVR